MMTAITFVFIAICLVEGVLIAREFFGTPKNTMIGNELQTLQSELKILSEKLAQSENTAEQAQRELQGIHALWNKAIQSEQALRRDLEIAKTQLTYLAQSLMKAKSETKTYWTEAAEEQTLPQAVRNENLRGFKSTSQLVQKDFI